MVVSSKSVMDIDGLCILPSEVSVDPETAAVSADRLSRLKCDKLFLAHQDSPVLERAQDAIQQAARVAIKNLKSVDNRLKIIASRKC